MFFKLRMMTHQWVVTVLFCLKMQYNQEKILEWISIFCKFFSVIYTYAYVYWVAKYDISHTVRYILKSWRDDTLERSWKNAGDFFFFFSLSVRAISSCFRKKRFISIHQVDAGQWHFCLNVLKKIMKRNQPHPGIIKQTGFKNQLDFKKSSVNMVGRHKDWVKLNTIKMIWDI